MHRLDGVDHHHVGRQRVDVADTWGSDVSATSHSDGELTPRRSARSATWRADSSAVT